MTTLKDVGLDRVCECLPKKFRGILVGPITTILGRWDQAGGSGASYSTAARLELGGAHIWIPAPLVPGDPAKGDAPIYLYRDREYVLPTIRLFNKETCSYCCLSEWLLKAFTEWEFKHKKDKSSKCRPKSITVLARLQEKGLKAEEVLAVFARVVRLAIYGSWPEDDYTPLEMTLELKLDRRSLGVKSEATHWLKKIEESSELARAVERKLVLTAVIGKKIRLPLGAKPRYKIIGVPVVSREAKHRINPSKQQDRGIDPVHTPEAEGIRSECYLGHGVKIEDRSLLLEPGISVSLSPSTWQIPFASFDAPRRLLLAAKMQVQAMELQSAEAPEVRVSQPNPAPPGVNMRVAYLAWQGLNHEDAWVLSETAAAKLTGTEKSTQTVWISSLEALPDIQVEEGSTVKRNAVLLKRVMLPAFLAPQLKGLIELRGHTDRLSPLDKHYLSDLQNLELEIESSVESKHAGTLERIEVIDLLLDSRSGVKVSPDAESKFRQVVKFHFVRERKLEVGDKLANRHGHKGIVGRILPDDQMPRWNGQPLDALIDPVSVLNRSNWGQIYETIFGAVVEAGKASTDMLPKIGRDELLELAKLIACNTIGQSLIEPPKSRQWLTDECLAVAGLQFVMRLPKHAAANITADVKNKTEAKSRRNHFSVQDTWAGWAYGIGLQPEAEPFRQLSSGASRLKMLLATAGIHMEMTGESTIRLAWQQLAGNAPEGEKRDLKKEGRTSVQNWVASDLTESSFLVFKPIKKVSLPGSGLKVTVRWISVPPLKVRPSETSSDGRVHHHPLTKLLQEVVRRGSYWSKGKDHRSKDEKLDEKFRTALQKLMRKAYRCALGSERDSKSSSIRTDVHSLTLARTGRAVASSIGLDGGGKMELNMDEVGLPPAIASAVLGKEIQTDEDIARLYGSERPFVWIKRDPVLHRWGLLSLRARVMPGNTIKLPPSLLKPLACDYDGDTVTVFGSIPAASQPPAAIPSKNAWDEVLKQPVFLPTKQYVYGLHLLQKDAEQMNKLNAELSLNSAPSWPKGKTAQDALTEWAGEAAQAPQPTGKWWELVEHYALLALAKNPGMNLGLHPPGTPLDELDVVTCGAAKKGVPGETKAAYTGNSLAIYGPKQEQFNTAQDMIETVMVPAVSAKGLFGNIARDIIYAARDLDEPFIRSVQALSERANQQVLSVKTGAAPLKYSSFKKQILKPLLKDGQLPNFEQLKEEEEFKELLGSGEMERICESILRKIDNDRPPWVKWLRQPYKLATLLNVAAVVMPLNDSRAGPFLSSLKEEESSLPEPLRDS